MTKIIAVGGKCLNLKEQKWWRKEKYWNSFCLHNEMFARFFHPSRHSEDKWMDYPQLLLPALFCQSKAFSSVLLWKMTDLIFVINKQWNLLFGGLFYSIINAPMILDIKIAIQCGKERSERRKKGRKMDVLKYHDIAGPPDATCSPMLYSLKIPPARVRSLLTFEESVCVAEVTVFSTSTLLSFSFTVSRKLIPFYFFQSTLKWKKLKKKRKKKKTFIWIFFAKIFLLSLRFHFDRFVFLFRRYLLLIYLFLCEKLLLVETLLWVKVLALFYS